MSRRWKETPMKVFLTGATGYVGGAVREELANQGHEVLGLSRSEESTKCLEDRGHQVVKGDLRNGLALAKAALEADAVIHTAFTNSRDGAAIDSQAMTALTLALEESSKPLIYTSSAWIYGDSGDEAVDENTPADPPPPLAWRHTVEEKVLAASRRGVGSIVIRPGVVYGDGGGILGWVRREAQVHGTVRVVENGKQRWPFVHRRDLARLFVRALGSKAGEVFNATAGPSAALNEVVRVTGSGPFGEAQVESWPLEEAREKLGAFADVMALDLGEVSSEKAMSALGWTPQERPVLSDALPTPTQGAVH
jgi:nucleoside-diphosphate-sugar epimerase